MGLHLEAIADERQQKAAMQKFQKFSNVTDFIHFWLFRVTSSTNTGYFCKEM